MKHLILLNALFYLPLLSMQQNAAPVLSSSQKTRAWSQQLENPLSQKAQQCFLALTTVQEDIESNSKFAQALEQFCQQAQNTPKFCELWKKNWQIQWLAAADTEVRVAQSLLNTNLIHYSINIAEVKTKKLVLAKALENQLRLEKFDEQCKHFFPTQN